MEIKFCKTFTIVCSLTSRRRRLLNPLSFGHKAFKVDSCLYDPTKVLGSLYLISIENENKTKKFISNGIKAFEIKKSFSLQ